MKQVCEPLKLVFENTIPILYLVSKILVKLIFVNNNKRPKTVKIAQCYTIKM